MEHGAAPDRAPHTQFAEATCGTIRLKLIKLGALVRISVRRVRFAMASGGPWQADWALAHTPIAQRSRLNAAPAQPDVRDTAECRQIERALEQTGGQVIKAADLLGWAA